MIDGMLETLALRLDSSRQADDGWSYPQSAPKLLLSCKSRGEIAILRAEDGIIQTWNDPLEALNWMQQHIRDAQNRKLQRWIGYLNYDLGRLFERLPSIAPDDLSLPLFVFGLCEREAPEEPVGRALPANSGSGGQCPPYKSTFTRGEYYNAIKRIIEYIAAGDVFQVNLSQRFTAPQLESPLKIYHRLTESTPAAYGGFLNFGDHVLLCNSPELFLRVDPEGHVITRPIKGTRPRQYGMEQQLLHSIKDQAELNMIVDLERNDLGRVCKIGSVRVTQPRVIEPHPTVYHGVATIEGLLRDDVTFVDLLRATFPGGSVTGAPKIRAMQIIDELELVRRGPYCGAIGYLDSDGTIQFNIAIRTMIVKGNQIHIPVGGGVVADSDPDQEYEETLVKARAMFAALGAEGFEPPTKRL